MKAITTTLRLLILTMLVVSNSLAQKASFTSNRGMTIGFGAGKTYQKSDLAYSNGLGFDFILGSQIYQKEKAFLSVDWKFRFLAGENKSYDLSIGTDNTISNVRYGFMSYDLELGLTLNRLRERTRIVVNGFAGAGITHGRTSTDLYDAGGNLYDYSSIDLNRETKWVYKDLLALSDGNYETRLVNKAAILPTAGLFVGYQISRSFAAGIEFKTNFCLTERNGVVGINLDNRILEGSSLDRNSFISARFRWTLRGRSSHKHAADNYSYNGTTNQLNHSTTEKPVVQVSTPQPSVNITDPTSDSYRTVSNTHTIWATVNHVSGPDQISFYQNGFPNNTFSYNRTTKIFIANVNLREGENQFRIQAKNQVSAAEDFVSITLENPPETHIPAPELGFTHPLENLSRSSSGRIDVTASVKNISRKQDIQLLLNGSNTSFEYNPASGLVRAHVVLTQGDNNFIIKGFNESGSAQDQLTVIFDNPEALAIPMIRFINPATQVYAENKLFPLSAEIQNVRGRDDLTVKLNGALIRNFSFSQNGVVSVSLFLSEGVNTIDITAKNEAGMASEFTSIAYQKPVYQQPVQYQPVQQQPVHQQPVQQQPVQQQPVQYQPVQQQPVQHQPVQDQPARRQPVQRQPVIRISPPVIHITSPATYPLKTYEGSEALQATVMNVSSKENITLNINGLSTRDFNFSSATKVLTARVALRDGKNVLTIQAQNESGTDVKDQVFVKESRPCPPPSIRVIEPGKLQSSSNQQNYTVRAEVRHIARSNQLRLTANGNPVSFSLNNNILSSQVTLVNGLNILALEAINECGEDKASAGITYRPPVAVNPCTPPRVSFNVNEVNRNDATHELRGSISGVNNKAGISLTVNGKPNNGFQFVPPTGELSAKFKLPPGSHKIVVSANNSCGTDSKSASISLEEEACGIRINPGNSSWQFCMVTPSGTYSRDKLTNSNFSYSGSASSLYIMPTGGGGNATVNGRPYPIKSGQYYLFTGSLNVTVSTKNPGSMGQWSVCISTDRPPVSGNGNNRPKSPCEVEKNADLKGNRNRR